MKKVLVTEPVPDAGLALLRERSDIELVIAENTQPDTLARHARDAHGIGVRMALLPAEVLADATALQVVSRHGVGCDNIDVEHLSLRGIPMAIAAGSNGRSVAEHTLMAMLATSRRLREQDIAIRQGRYPDRVALSGNDLHRRQVLVVGFGRTGKQVAALCRAMDMEVTVADIKLDREHATTLGCKAVEDFRPELATADFVTMHVPLDKTTRNMIAAAEFEAMKTGAILINCARGNIVEESALLDALDSGKLSSAAFDVFATEPTPANYPLLARDDIICTPHTAGTSQGALRRMSEMMAQNILDCFDGKLREDCVLNAEVIRSESA